MKKRINGHDDKSSGFLYLYISQKETNIFDEISDTC